MEEKSRTKFAILIAVILAAAVIYSFTFNLFEETPSVNLAGPGDVSQSGDQDSALLGDAAVFAPAHLAYLRPASVAALAAMTDKTVDYLTLAPMYLRAPSAERNRRLMEAANGK